MATSSAVCISNLFKMAIALPLTAASTSNSTRDPPAMMSIVSNRLLHISRSKYNIIGHVKLLACFQKQRGNSMSIICRAGTVRSHGF